MNVPNWKQQLAAELKRDKKKAIIFGVLLLVLLIVAGRLIIQKVGSSSEDKTNPKVSSADNSLSNSRNTGVSPGIADRSSVAARINVDRIFDRDLFVPNPDFFPSGEVANPTKVNVKPAEDPTELKRAKERAVRMEAQSLELVSTIIGATPVANINGKMLREGESIKGFVVRKITSRACVLDKDGVTVTLVMRN